uniref:Uncharacterized protein n=1 Tax=Romanomermis culicivorax TaxID=13658 RepID=A0A915KJ85_ROMCU
MICVLPDGQSGQQIPDFRIGLGHRTTHSIVPSVTTPLCNQRSSVNAGKSVLKQARSSLFLDLKSPKQEL